MKNKLFLSAFIPFIVLGLGSCSLDNIIDMNPLETTENTGNINQDGSNNSQYKILTIVNSAGENDSTRSVSVKMGDTVDLNKQLSLMPTYNDKEFDSWYVDADYKTKYPYSSIKVENNLTIYAKYLNIYTVSYYINGQEVGNEKVKEGQYITSDNPTKLINDFSSSTIKLTGEWLDSDNKPFIFDKTAIMFDTTLNAETRKLQYLLFINDDSTQFEKRTFFEGEEPAIETKEVPVSTKNDGFIYKFNHWQEIESKTSNTRIYEPVYDKYVTVKYYNLDDSRNIIPIDQDSDYIPDHYEYVVKVGDTIKYDGTTPQRRRTSKFWWDFIGWSTKIRANIKTDINETGEITVTDENPEIIFYAYYRNANVQY